MQPNAKHMFDELRAAYLELNCIGQSSAPCFVSQNLVEPSERRSRLRIQRCIGICRGNSLSLNRCTTPNTPPPNNLDRSGRPPSKQHVGSGRGTHTSSQHRFGPAALDPQSYGLRDYLLIVLPTPEARASSIIHLFNGNFCHHSGELGAAQIHLALLKLSSSHGNPGKVVEPIERLHGSMNPRRRKRWSTTS